MELETGGALIISPLAMIEVVESERANSLGMGWLEASIGNGAPPSGAPIVFH